MSETKNIKKMKAVRLHAIGDLRCDEMEVPVPKGEELLIKVGACGVCGSDYPRTYEHGTSSGIYPLTIGHEFAGEVIGTVQRIVPQIVLQRGIPSARRAEKELAQRERGQLVFQEPREQRTDVAETARCRKMRNGKTARLLEGGSGLSAAHRAEENGQKWRKMRP